MARQRFGVNRVLEEEADRLIRESLRGVTKHSEKADILTPWKQEDRRQREVYVKSGTPDPAVNLGMFHRSYNPVHVHLNARDGVAQALAHTTPLRQRDRLPYGAGDSHLDSLGGFVGGESHD